MYTLHDNGRKLFDSPQNCTPMQRFVYVMAKNYHTDDPNEGTAQPSGLDKSERFNDATSSFQH